MSHKRTIRFFISLLLVTTLLSSIAFTAFATEKITVEVAHALTDHDGKYGESIDKGEEVLTGAHPAYWTTVYRPKNSFHASSIAAHAKAICEKPIVGYAFNDDGGKLGRSGLFYYVIEHNWSLDGIDSQTGYCDTDCAAFVKTCVLWAGIARDRVYNDNLYVEKDKPDAENYTDKWFDSTGKFTTYKLRDYPNGFAVKRGDIIKSDNHIAVVLKSSIITISPTQYNYTIKVGNTCTIGANISSSYNLKKITILFDGSKLLKTVYPEDTTQCTVSHCILRKFLSVGSHTVQIKAWDISGNVVYKTIRITVTPKSSFTPVIIEQ